MDGSVTRVTSDGQEIEESLAKIAKNAKVGKGQTLY
jgi:hypothetical protein